MNDWMLDVLPQMLEHLRDNGCGVSGIFYEDDWNDDESAIKRRYDCFTEIIQHFYNATEDCEKAEQKNEYKETYSKDIIKNIKCSSNEFSKCEENYHKREMELYNWRQEEVKKAFAMLAEIFPALWD